jgi:hypothetical protein
MGWKDYARQIQEAQHTGHARHDNSLTTPSVPSVPNVPEVPPLDHARALKLCQGQLARLDPVAPLHDIPVTRWWRLIEDADWLLQHFAAQAFRDGWMVSELFGLWWWDDQGARVLKDAWGGIADRLQGSRSLVMTADRARWRRMLTGEPDLFARGTYQDLRPMWEVGQ